MRFTFQPLKNWTLEAPHRIRNAPHRAKEKIAKIMEKDNRNDALLRKLQDVVFPDKADPGALDRQALGRELRKLAELCDAQQLQTLPDPEILPEMPVFPEVSVKTRKKPKRDFNFSDYRTRFVALNVLYLGWDYSGFASQDCEKTVEVGTCSF